MFYNNFIYCETTSFFFDPDTFIICLLLLSKFIVNILKYIKI